MKDRIPKLNSKNNIIKTAPIPESTTLVQLIQMFNAGLYADVMPNNATTGDNIGVDEVGTPLNKANLFSDSTSALHHISSNSAVNDLLAFIAKYNVASFMSFCGNVNSNMLDGAFGKGNLSRMANIGMQLAMYAWFCGADEASYPFTKLKECNTWEDCVANAFDEIIINANLQAIYLASPYAVSKVNAASIMAAYKNNYNAMNNIMTHPTAINFVRDTADFHAALHSNRTILTTVGTGTYTVPAGVYALTVACIGGGGNGGGAGGSGGAYIQSVLSVTPGQTIPYTVGAAAANTVFGGFTAIGAGGALGGQSNNTDGATPSQDGKLIKVSNGGGHNGLGGMGGGGGYGGGSAYLGGSGSQDIGDGGAGAICYYSTNYYGYGGGGYGGGGGGRSGGGGTWAGGQGAIAIFHI